MGEEELKLMRKVLGSIDLTDIEEDLDEAEILARAGDAEIFYRNHFDKVIKKLIQDQLEFIGKEIQPEQLPFARGTINGLSLIKQWFEDQIRLSLSRHDKEQGTEPGSSGLPHL